MTLKIAYEEQCKIYNKYCEDIFTHYHLSIKNISSHFNLDTLACKYVYLSLYRMKETINLKITVFPRLSAHPRISAPYSTRKISFFLIKTYFFCVDTSQKN